VLRRFGTESEEGKRGWRIGEDCTVRSFMTCKLHHTSLG